ncbi:LicD family protein [Granulosicoccus sp.]|nr:LicD family protein [Granulosicoccus sp.]
MTSLLGANAGTGATLEIRKGWLHGECSSHKTGMVELKIDNLQITYLPLVADADTAGSRFTFPLSQSLVSSLPSEYTATVALPCGTETTMEGAAAFGSGDGSLASKLANGYMVSTKAGYLFKPPASENGWKERIHTAYSKARAAINEINAVSGLFVAYGSLLGQVRSGDFIAHDDDFDAGIFLEADTPGEAAIHYYRIVNTLRERGHKVTCPKSHMGNFHLYIPDLPPVDVFLFFYRNSTRELCSYNLAYVCEKDTILPLRQGSLSGKAVLIPNKADELLAATYGEYWRTPDPYFQWNITTRQDLWNCGYRTASRAISCNEDIPEFEDPWL